MSNTKTPNLLVILDGWGYRDSAESNAIRMADTPVWDSLLARYPHSLIHTSGLRVGLPAGQMGNSEVGHMNLGAGRVVYQSLTRINKAIEDGDFFSNPVLTGTADAAVANDGALHIIGLLSPGGIHSHEDQIAAMIALAVGRGCQKIFLHALLDGRDTPPRSAKSSLEKFTRLFAEKGCGKIATIGGRFFGMDRDKRWDRVEKAYNAIACGQAEFSAESALKGLEAAYARDEDDEFVTPCCIRADAETALRIEEGDAVVFMNFRADRARELTRAFIEPDFDGFERPALLKPSRFVTLTRYAEDLPVECAFPPEPLKNGLGEYLASLHKTQLRIAETEKYAHVTFFFSGGEEREQPGETRILVPSPKVKTYDMKPEMSAYEVTEKLVNAIKSREYDAIICNYANGDMVGHTGNLAAAIKAVEALDDCLGRLTGAILETGGNCLITADHGNVEQMIDDKTGQSLTSHTDGPVPLVYVGAKKLMIRADGSLCDIAPSLLTLMGLPQPPEMTGHSLIELQ